jgi:hypothetical protein
LRLEFSDDKRFAEEPSAWTTPIRELLIQYSPDERIRFEPTKHIVAMAVLPPLKSALREGQLPNL